MTSDEARIIVLEDALVQAIHTVEFLHGCLTAPSPEEVDRVVRAGRNLLTRREAEGKPCGCLRSSYGYPEQTSRAVAEWRMLVCVPTYCHHSYYAPSRGEHCQACVDSKAQREKLAAAQAVLDNQTVHDPQGDITCDDSDRNGDGTS